MQRAYSSNYTGKNKQLSVSVLRVVAAVVDAVADVAATPEAVDGKGFL